VKRVLWLLLALAWTSRVEARADFVLVADGGGFSDATPVQPVGGNEGTTLGDQRRRALARALEIWGAALDSPVPIVVQATFPELNCTDNGAVLGQAYAWQFMRNLPGQAERTYFPSALADRILGRDLAAGMPDLAIELNASIDEADCEDVAGHWYYGFDGSTPDGENDLIQVALHELAHGFGFASTVDPRTGTSQFTSGDDVFTTRIFDLDRNQRWDALSASERVTSASNVRRLAFDGENARTMSRGLLETGVPSLSLAPLPSGISLTRAVSDVELATNPAESPVSGPLVVANPSDACSSLLNDVRGAVVLLENSPACRFPDSLAQLAAAGAVGAVYLVAAPATSPAEPLDAYGYGSASSVRAVTVSSTTGRAIYEASKGPAITATLGGEAGAWLGADAEGRPLLFASEPGLPGSSLSHFDSLARPNLLMEAYVQGGSNHDVDLALAVLRDLGWTRTCGDGELDADEQCDLGSLNSDATGSGCRRNCLLPGCGDGVKEASEGCDDGADNSDIEAGSCRTTCEPAHCGDGVMDSGEVCDQGIGNSDVEPDTCRTNCTLARCGDGVVDSNESCDGTPGCDATCRNASDAGSPDASGLQPWPDDVDGEGRASGGCALSEPSSGWLLVLALVVMLARTRRRGVTTRSL
jgi:MYXO-CTERM domain-containing protein